MKKNLLAFRHYVTLPRYFPLSFKKWQSVAMRQPMLLAFPLIGLILFGCRPAQPVAVKGVVDDIRVELRASADCVQPGERVRLEAVVINESSTTVVVETRDQPVLDIWVGGTAATPRFRWSDGKFLTSDITRLELRPGESKTIDMNWIPDSSIQGPVLVQARFVYVARTYEFSLPPNTLINVKYCPGPLGR
ncbi:MAG: hypothetical protein HY782_04690 [Chloroflexi bacterium]|nr:hypothetical protein [Chloroflexota bacterium]